MLDDKVLTTQYIKYLQGQLAERNAQISGMQVCARPVVENNISISSVLSPPNNFRHTFYS